VAQTIQVMIVDDSDEVRESLRMLLGTMGRIVVLAEANNGEEALRKLELVEPDIILMDLNMPVMDGVEATERISAAYPNISVVVLSVQDDVEYVRRSMRAGAKDYLFKPISGEALEASLTEIFESTQVRASRNTVALLSDRFTRQTRVITCVSAKGGVGKTTVAVNVAAALSAEGRRVAFVDCDLQFGDAALMLNLNPSRTIADLCRETRDIDGDVVESYLAEATANLWLLAAPKRPEESDYVAPGQVRLILQALRRRFDYVVVDTAPIANDLFFTILESVDDVLCISTQNVAVLKNNRLLLDLLGQVGYEQSQLNSPVQGQGQGSAHGLSQGPVRGPGPAQRSTPNQAVKHIITRASSSRAGVRIRDAEKVLQGSVYAEIDNDYAFVEGSINEGVPFVLSNRLHRLSKQIYQLTTKLEQEAGYRTPRRNPLHRILGGSGAS